jgi:ribosome-binding ATPase YchF (GTP1/OBG family)
MSELEIEEVAPKVEEQIKKPRRKINISDEERQRRSDRMKELAKKRTELAEEKKSKIKEVKVEVNTEARKIIDRKVRKIKQPPVIQPESSDDSDSDESTLLSKPKRKYNRKATPNIIIKNYTQSAPAPQQQPIPQVFQQQPSAREQSPPKQHIGFFV